MADLFKRMALRRLVAMAIFCPEIWCAHGEAPQHPPHPCFSSEAVPTNERRFFSFAPANVRSEPPVDCVFVFGGPPGTRLRLGLYDVKTSGPKIFRGQESASLCDRDVIRVYDLGSQGLQVKAAYCGVLRRGKMLSMSSNMAVVTYTSDSNDPSNAFNLGVDAIEAGRSTTTAATPRATAPTRPCASTAASTTAATAPAPTAGGDGSEVEVAEAATAGGRAVEDGEWGVVASGDSDESEEQGGAWYLDSDGSVVPVISTGATTAPPPAAGGGAAEAVGVDGRLGAVPEVEKPVVAPTRSWGAPEAGGLDGEDTGKVVTVYSNGTGDEDDDAIAFYYYL